MRGSTATGRWWAEPVALAVILVIAALARLIDLPTRGTWDADQGHDMQVLAALIRDGMVPLLGPPTSIGDIHHGALYYYLLAPAAAVSGADPLAVVGFVALGGVLAVAVVWWLARSVGGPHAGLVAAAVMAVSTSAIEESTFIWNPNLIALSSAVSFAAAWRAWSGGAAGWWVVAAAAQAVTQHLHVLGIVLLVPLAALLVADLRRRAPAARRPVGTAALAGLAVLALSYLPLAIHEVRTGGEETQALLAYLAGDGREGGAPLIQRLLVVPLRIVSWPLTGLITNQPLAALVAAGAVVVSIAWRLRVARGREQEAVAWMAATLAWSALALALASPSLATVVPGLPNDHYHAFLDPIVFSIVGLGIAGLWREGIAGRLAPGRALAAVALAALVAFNVAHWPPREAPDGGYPAAERAARRILDFVGRRPYLLDGLPTIKNTEALGFPLQRLGRPPVDEMADGDARDLVIVCDRLLEPIIGASCDGPAEDAWAATVGGDMRLVERFDLSGRTVVSIYR